MRRVFIAVAFLLFVVAHVGCAHPMHVDAEPGAEVWVDDVYAGHAPVDVDVPPGVNVIRLRVDDRGKSHDTIVQRRGVAPSTYGASALAGVATAGASLASVGIFHAYLDGIRRDPAQPFDAICLAGVAQYFCTPLLCATAAAFTGAAIAAPVAIAGEEQPPRVRVDVERGEVQF